MIYNYHLSNKLDKKVIFFPETLALYELDDEAFLLLKESLTTKNFLSLPDELKVFLEENNSKNNIEHEINDYEIKNVCLAIVQSCNMKCLYCYGEEGTYGSQGMMDFETAINSLKKLFNNNFENRRITFFGGEPLLNFELIKKIVTYIKENYENQPGYSITTNAVLINEEMAEFFSENKFSLLVSLDGNEEIQNMQRPLNNNENSYEAVMKGIKLLEDKKCNYSLRGTLTNTNTKDNKNENNILYVPVVSTNNETLLPDIAEYEKHLELYFYNLGEKKILKQHEDILKLLKHRKINIIGCSTGFNYLTVSHNGDAYYCHRYNGDKRFFVGNVLTDSLDIIEVNRKQILDTFHMALKNESKCTECWAKHICAGGCMHERLESKKYKEKDENYYCNIYKIKYEYLFSYYAKSFEGGI